MTRRYNQRVRCHNCGAHTTEESPFERWVRAHPLLQTGEGIVRFDLDILLHRYKGLSDLKGDRTIQAMMFVEVKTYMAVPSDAQVDTLSVLNQLLRNRKPNIHSAPRRQSAAAPVKVFSKKIRRDVRVALFGGHLLQLDGLCPASSSAMLWDYTPITQDQLIELFRFERNPDNPSRKLDIRRRSQPFSQMRRLF